MAQNSQSTLSALDNNTKKVVENTSAIRDLHFSVKDKSVEMDGFTGVIKALKGTKDAIEKQPEKVVKKIEEIKSANLISNKLLKEIRDKKIPESPAVQKVELQGAELVTIKGAKGDKGEKGERGEKGEQGKQGKDGVDGKDGNDGRNGKDGLNGKNGLDGKDGKNGVDGKDGKDGKDADEKKIIKEVLKKMPDIAQDTMNQVGYVGGMGGSGWKVTTPVGAVNSSNTTYTVDRSPFYVVADGISYFEGAGYTYSGGTITMTTPPASYIRSYQL